MPSSAIHLQLHGLRAAELRAEAATYAAYTSRHRTRRTPHLRARLGWFLVELGLRLVNRPALQPT